MGGIDEELHLLIIQFPSFALVVAADEIPPDEGCNEQIDENGPCGQVPGVLHHDGQREHLRRCHTVTFCTYFYLVGAWLHLAK